MKESILKSTRIKLGLSQESVCSGICSRGMLSLIERGQAKPSIRVLTMLCERLNLAVDDVLKVGQRPEQDERITPMIEYLNELLLLKDYEVVIKRAKETLGLKYILADNNAQVDILIILARALHRTKHYSESLKNFQKGCELAGGISDRRKYIDVLNGVASAFLELNNYEEAYAKFIMCDELIDENKDPAAKIRIQYNLATVLRKMDKNDKAKAMLRAGLNLCRRTGIYEVGGHLESLMGLIYWDENNLTLAKKSFTRALSFYQFIEDGESIEGTIKNLAELDRLQSFT